MSKAEFLNELSEIVELPPGSLQGGEKLADLDGWTSMAMMSFIALADEKFDKQISPRAFVNCETVDDLGKLVGLPG